MAPKRKTISNLTTPLKAKLHAKPRDASRSIFLEKFIIEKTRWRLNQERENLASRVSEIDAHLALIEKSVTDLDESETRERAKRAAPDVAGTHERAAAHGMKVVKVEY